MAPNPGRNYLWDRKVSADSIINWRIGYDPGRGLRAMEGRITLPLLDYHGRVVSVTGRKVFDHAWGPKYYHLPFYKGRWLYGLQQPLKKGATAIITEGHFSAILLSQLGYLAYAVMGSTLSTWQAGHLIYIAAACGQQPPYRFVVYPDKDKPDSAAEWTRRLSAVAPVICAAGDYPPITPDDCDPDWLAQHEPETLQTMLGHAAEKLQVGGFPYANL